MNTARTLFLVSSLVAASSTDVLAGEWEIDPVHSAVQFSVRHMMVSTVSGRFEKVSGAVTIDDQDATRSTIEVTIDAASINTHESKRDAHLRSADFFDVATYPTITFKSTKIEKAGGGKLKATGDLTMRGVTKKVTLIVSGLGAPVKNPWGQVVRGASATGKLDRRQWGLTWNKALEVGGVLVGDMVQLQIDVELLAKTTPPPAAK
jgi:polyisoprenoid-binding protein YceI